MIILSNKKFKNGSTEFLLIDLVNNNPKIIEDNTIKEVANLLFVNASSLSRAVKRIGYPDWKSFRDYIVKKTIEVKDIKHLEHFDKIKDLLENFKYLNKSIVENTLNSIQENELSAIADEILKYKNINFYGIGFSNYMCDQLSNHFNLMGLRSQNITKFYDALKLIDHKKDNLEKSLWFIISKTLTTKEICFIVEELLLEKEPIILITSNPDSPYLKKIKNKIVLVSPYKDDDVYSISSKMSTLIISNLIIEVVANKINFNRKEKVSLFGERTKKWKKFAKK